MPIICFFKVMIVTVIYSPIVDFEKSLDFIYLDRLKLVK